MQTFTIAVYVDAGWGCHYVYRQLEAESKEEAEAYVKKVNDNGTICFLVEKK